MADVISLAKRHKLKVFHALPYPVNVIVYNMADTGALLKVIPDHPPGDDGTMGRMCGIRRDGCNIITIGLRNDLDQFMPTVAHECYHALNQIFLWFGVRHDEENDEAAAYMLGYLVGQTTGLWAEITEGGANG